MTHRPDQPRRDSFDDVAFRYFEQELLNSTADPRIFRNLPEHVRAWLPIRANRHDAWSRARDDFRGYSRQPFTELWDWLRSVDVLRSPTSDERAAMAKARELTGLDLPTGSDVVELEKLRVVLPDVHEKLMRH